MESVCVLTEELVVDRDLAIDLNGFDVTSYAVCAFNVESGVEFEISGNADIQLSGMLVRSTGTDFKVTVIGTSGTDGIALIHNGKAHNKITSSYSGEWYFENMDITSTTEAVEFDSFFDTNDITEKANTNRPLGEDGKKISYGADMTFNRVEFTYDVPLKKDAGQFVTNVYEKGHLYILNSGFHTQHSGVHI